MRYILMHKANARDEAGEKPTPELMKKVGAMVGDLVKSGVLRAGDGLRPSALGLRLRFHGGKREALPGPFQKGNELLSGFIAVKVRSLDEAAQWADRYAAIVGDCELDIRPFTEPWDLGGQKPPGHDTIRYMIGVKADRDSESGKPPPAAVAKLLETMKAEGVLLLAERLAPSSQALRLHFKRGKPNPTMTDGPFAESKELVGGFVVVDVPTRDEAVKLSIPYGNALGDLELDVRPLLEA
jgi:hypothetical protein